MKKWFQKHALLIMVLFIWTCLCTNQAVNFYERNVVDGIHPDVITSFIYLDSYDSLALLQLFPGILVCLFALYPLYQEVSSGNIKLHLTRTSYRAYLLGHLRRSMKYILLLPVMVGILFSICFIVFQGNFDIVTTSNVFSELSTVAYPYLDKIPIYLCMVFLIPLLLSIFWIEIGYYFIKKERNFFIPLLLVFLVTNFIEMIQTRIFMGLHIDYQSPYYFTYNYLVTPDKAYLENPLYMIVSILCAIGVMAIILWIRYFKKERLVLESEA